MADAPRQFLNRMLETPSVSGYEASIQKVVREYIGESADEVRGDSHGNLIASLNPGGGPRIQFAGHCDQIGFLVQHIEESGFLRFSGVGGHDRIILVGQPVTVWTKEGPLPGVMARKPIHLLSQSDRTKVPEMTKLWIDTGLTGEEAKQRIRIGDPITYELKVRDLQNGLISSPGMDNKTGVFVVMEALRLLAEDKDNVQAAVFSVSTVQEEIGLRGARTSAFGIDPQVGIASDVTFTSDVPDVELAELGDIRLGAGPVIARGPNINPIVFERLVEAAEAADIPYQIEAVSKATGTDANALQISRGGIATGLVSIPNRYMHSPVEVCHWDDLNNAARLVAEFTKRLTADVDWVPQA